MDADQASGHPEAHSGSPSHDAVTFDEATIAGIRCVLIKPTEQPEGRMGQVLVALLDGVGAEPDSLGQAVPLACIAQIPVVVPEIKSSDPAVVQNLCAVYKVILEYHRPGQIGLVGWGRGGKIAVDLIGRLRQEALPHPGALAVGSDARPAGGTQALPLNLALADDVDAATLPAVLLLSGDGEPTPQEMASLQSRLQTLGAAVDLRIPDRGIGHVSSQAEPGEPDAARIMNRFFSEQLGHA